ncbi:unnamed protein product [Caenorhabditis auriculariae]|uniref:Uncharacterized protein n=1 Tax=Caenorhabditis auriculariae TaxID=2777116 RepID=A0A8S1GQF3_9PELO|nr:unnamed protein product [Caenorhabditis auriculariae]
MKTVTVKSYMNRTLKTCVTHYDIGDLPPEIAAELANFPNVPSFEEDISNPWKLSPETSPKPLMMPFSGKSRRASTQNSREAVVNTSSSTKQQKTTENGEIKSKAAPCCDSPSVFGNGPRSTEKTRENRERIPFVRFKLQKAVEESETDTDSDRSFFSDGFYSDEDDEEKFDREIAKKMHENGKYPRTYDEDWMPLR